MKSQAPVLMSEGSIVIRSGEGQLARVSACGQTVWSIARHFHHSIELTNDGNILAAIVSRDAPGVPARDDGHAIVSPDGKILHEIGLLKIPVKT